MYNFKTDIKFHNELQACSNAVYGEKGYELPSVYTHAEKPIYDLRTGFSAFILKKGNNIVIAFGGSHEPEDFGNDIDLILNRKTPDQFIQGLELYKRCKEKYKNYTIYLTGDSLGGSIAQYTEAKTGAPTVTFNARGVGNFVIREGEKPKSDNIINYVSKLDFFPSGNAQNIVGKCYELETKNPLWSPIIFGDHVFINQKPITEQKEIKKEELEYWEEIQPIKARISKNVKKRFPLKDLHPKIDEALDLYIEELMEIPEKLKPAAKSVVDKYNTYMDKHMYRDKFYQFVDSFSQTPPESKPVSYGGKIYIKEYRRMDGTRVEGHWRSLPDDAGFDPNKKLTDMDKDELDKALDFYMDVYK